MKNPQFNSAVVVLSVLRYIGEEPQLSDTAFALRAGSWFSSQCFQLGLRMSFAWNPRETLPVSVDNIALDRQWFDSQYKAASYVAISKPAKDIESKEQAHLSQGNCYEWCLHFLLHNFHSKRSTYLLFFNESSESRPGPAVTASDGPVSSCSLILQ